MDTNQRKPAWWLLYATVPLFFVLVWPALQLHMPFWAHPGVEIGILVLTFGLIGLWLHANGKALWRQNMRGEGGPHWRIIYSVPVRPGGVTQDENNSGSDELDNSNESFSFQIDDLSATRMSTPGATCVKTSQNGKTRTLGKIRAG